MKSPLLPFDKKPRICMGGEVAWSPIRLCLSLDAQRNDSPQTPPDCGSDLNSGLYALRQEIERNCPVAHTGYGSRNHFL